MLTLKDYKKKAWNELENIKIIQNNGGGNSVAIYFSSNNLYYLDTTECLENTIYKKDRYEWTKLMIDRASKHIFVRDVFKTWYITGINSQIYSIPLLLEKLKNEVDGYDEIITIGSSAGGYAASLFGSLLKADIVISFNGQWELNSVICNHGYPRLETLRDLYGEFYDIVPFVGKTNNIFYFVSSKSKWDMEQVQYSRKLSLHRIYFRTSHHGIPFPKIALPYVLNLRKEDLLKMADKTYLPFIFAIKRCGLMQTCMFLFNEITRKFKINKCKLW